MLRRLTVMTMLISAVSGVCGCTRVPAGPAVPYIPPAYFSCTEVVPQVLYDAYYSRYATIAMAEVQFNDTYFVFKNIKLEAQMLANVKDGYFWASYGRIKCYLINPTDMKNFKVGDKIDCVGLDIGDVMGEAGLVFKNCIVLSAGCVELPADGMGGAPVPMY